MDIVGPLPCSENKIYLFTIVDRFTRWPEAIPLADATTETCARGLIRHWIARFGVPDDLTSDRGPQFTSHLWAALNKLLGISASTTTAYHPQANGMVERFHRQLKASLKARLSGPNWMDELPLVLLGIRSAWREDIDCSAADLVYGTGLHVPGEFLPQPAVSAPPPTEFLRHLQDTMRKALPTPPEFHGKHPEYKPHNLAATGFVYVRHDAHRGPLQRPYTGPFKILETAEKTLCPEYQWTPGCCVCRPAQSRLSPGYVFILILHSIPPSGTTCTACHCSGANTYLTLRQTHQASSALQIGGLPFHSLSLGGVMWRPGSEHNNYLCVHV